RARLGRRLSTTLSDADVFVVRNETGERRVFSFDVSGIPNMDIVVDVVRAGIERPVLRADSGGRGGRESVPNFVLENGVYYLRVRDTWMKGDYPTENVSDPYTIAGSFVTPGPEDEREVNESIELANTIELGARARGYIGWVG